MNQTVHIVEGQGLATDAREEPVRLQTPESVYPTPATENVAVRMNLAVPGAGETIMFKVFRTPRSAVTGSVEFRIDTAELGAPGLYIVQARRQGRVALAMIAVELGV